MLGLSGRTWEASASKEGELGFVPASRQSGKMTISGWAFVEGGIDGDVSNDIEDLCLLRAPKVMRIREDKPAFMTTDMVGDRNAD